MGPLHSRRRPAANLTPLQLRRKIGLLRQGWSGARIARDLGVSPTTVSLVLRDRCRSERVEMAIAAVVGEPVDRLFPERPDR